MTWLTPNLLLKIALGWYAAGVLASLLALRRERVANAVGFGSAVVASVCGIGAAMLALAGGPVREGGTFELWASLVPYVKLTVKLDPLGAFFVLIVSALGLALSVYSFGYVRGFYGRKSVGA